MGQASWGGGGAKAQWTVIPWKTWSDGTIAKHICDNVLLGRSEWGSAGGVVLAIVESFSNPKLS